MVVAKDIDASPTSRWRDAAQSVKPDEQPSFDDAPLPEGIEDYIGLFRKAQQGAKTVSAVRLRSDMNASAFASPLPSNMQVATTFIVLEGREIGVRIYHPGADIVRPALCYFHGGGFAFGSIETFDSIAAALAEETGAVVASVEYRRLPESTYEKAQDDCYQSLLWLQQHAGDLNIDPSRIGVAGDSVGALLATTAAMQVRQHNLPAPACQILMYGAFALEPGRDAYAISRDPLLTGDKVESFIDLYWKHRETDTQFVPPLSCDDLSGLPPAIIMAAERDPLCDEALEYAQRLERAGVPVCVRTAPGMIHGFLRARAVSPAAAQEMKILAANAKPYLWLDSGRTAGTESAK